MHRSKPCGTEDDHRGTLTIVSHPTDATIRFVEKEHDYYPGIKLDRGLYKIIVTAPGHRPQGRKIHIGGFEVVEYVDLRKQIDIRFPEGSIFETGGSELAFDISLTKAPLQNLFRSLVRDTELNVAVASEIEGTYTGDFKNITLNEIVTVLANLYNLDVSRVGHTIVVKLADKECKP